MCWRNFSEPKKFDPAPRMVFWQRLAVRGIKKLRKEKCASQIYKLRLLLGGLQLINPQLQIQTCLGVSRLKRISPQTHPGCGHLTHNDTEITRFHGLLRCKSVRKPRETNLKNRVFKIFFIFLLHFFLPPTSRFRFIISGLTVTLP